MNNKKRILVSSIVAATMLTGRGVAAIGPLGVAAMITVTSFGGEMALRYFIEPLQRVLDQYWNGQNDYAPIDYNNSLINQRRRADLDFKNKILSMEAFSNSQRDFLYNTSTDRENDGIYRISIGDKVLYFGMTGDELLGYKYLVCDEGYDNVVKAFDNRAEKIVLKNNSQCLEKVSETSLDDVKGRLSEFIFRCFFGKIDLDSPYNSNPYNSIGSSDEYIKKCISLAIENVFPRNWENITLLSHTVIEGYRLNFLINSSVIVKAEEVENRN